MNKRTETGYIKHIDTVQIPSGDNDANLVDIIIDIIVDAPRGPIRDGVMRALREAIDDPLRKEGFSGEVVYGYRPTSGAWTNWLREEEDQHRYVAHYNQPASETPPSEYLDSGPTITTDQLNDIVPGAGRRLARETRWNDLRWPFALMNTAVVDCIVNPIGDSLELQHASGHFFKPGVPSLEAQEQLYRKTGKRPPLER